MSLLSSILALLAAITNPIIQQPSIDPQQPTNQPELPTIITRNPSYVLESSTLLNGIIPLKKYKTTKTGMKIVIANTEGPVVNGYLCLATRAHDDNGAPHCLEHLVFAGSEDYPYKGALLQIATRCYSAATNAYTAIDRTCYKSSHVGKNGFIALLPVYLDHILYPTLKPSAFITEVHNVNGEGLDGGVVYSEMEAAFYDRNSYAMLNALYKDYGYSSYFGGAVKNLRENSTNQQNIDFHKQFYRPDNLCITVFGDITIDDVMSSIKQTEAKIASKPKLPKVSRPWQAPMPELKTTVVKTLLPSKNEGFAEMYIAWRGPNRGTESRKYLACTVLVSYLSNTATAGDTFATYVTGYTMEAIKTALYFTFTDVPLEKVDLVYEKFHNRLKNVTTRIEKIDMDEIHSIIDGKLSTFSSQLETAPSDTISDIILSDFLYGSTSNDFKTIINFQEELKYLLTVRDTYWINLLKEYFINKKYIQAIGIPSQAEIDRLNREDKEQIEKRIQSLGPAGLEKKANELAAAIAENSKPVPDSVLNSIPVPSTGNVNYYDVKTYRSGEANDGMPSELDINSWPSYAEVYDYPTNYVYITATFFTANIATNLRPYLYLLLKLIKESYFNEEEDAENVALNKFVPVNTDYRIGLTDPKKYFSCGRFSQTAAFMIQVEKTEYETGVKFLIAGQSSVFDAESVKSKASSLLSYVSSSTDDLPKTALDLLRTMYYKPDTNTKTYSMIYQKKFLTSLLTMLDNKETAQKVIDDLNTLRAELISSSNLAVHVSADISALNNTDLNGPWQRFKFNRGAKKLNIVSDWEVMHAADTVSSQGEVIGLSTTDTASLFHASPAITDFNSEDVAPLLVALNYLCQREGPLWTRVRGPGYVYLPYLQLFPNEGIIVFQLLQASDLVHAFDESVKVINEHSQPDAVWKQTLLDSAKSATIYQTVNLESKLADVPLHSILLSFQKVSPDYDKNLIPKITAVTIDDLKRVAQLYITKIFSTTEAKTSVVCNKNDANVISDGLKKHGFDLPVRQSWEDSLLGQF